jgi:hypothetical protein
MPEGNDREADRRILLNAEGKNRKHKCLVMPSSYLFIYIFSHLGGGKEMPSPIGVGKLSAYRLPNRHRPPTDFNRLISVR